MFSIRLFHYLFTVILLTFTFCINYLMQNRLSTQNLLGLKPLFSFHYSNCCSILSPNVLFPFLNIELIRVVLHWLGVSSPFKHLLNSSAIFFYYNIWSILDFLEVQTFFLCFSIFEISVLLTNFYNIFSSNPRKKSQSFRSKKHRNNH